MESEKGLGLFGDLKTIPPPVDDKLLKPAPEKKKYNKKVVDDKPDEVKNELSLSSVNPTEKEMGLDQENLSDEEPVNTAEPTEEYDFFSEDLTELYDAGRQLFHPWVFDKLNNSDDDIIAYKKLYDKKEEDRTKSETERMKLLHERIFYRRDKAKVFASRVPYTPKQQKRIEKALNRAFEKMGTSGLPLWAQLALAFAVPEIILIFHMGAVRLNTPK